MKAAFITLGCKTNSYDTQAMMKILKDAGYDIVNHHDIADVYIINTCAVTNISEAKSRQAIHKAVKNNPGAVVIAAGCYSQLSPNDVINIPGVDAVVGIKDRHRLADIIQNARSQKTMEVYSISDEHIFEHLSVDSFDDKTRAFIKIQEGCDNYCSYCIIPYARGPARSRSAEDIISEVKNIVASGHREIILTGIHIASYGKDLNNISLIDLIEKLNDIKSLKRIRLGSLEPKILNEAFLARLSRLNKVCPSFHISLQSGCDNTLMRMNRKYTSKEYYDIVCNVRKFFPRCSITTDVIVGFPAESEEDFTESYEFCKKVGFMKIHVFPFSLKKGTAAEHIAPKIEKSVIKNRCDKMLALSASMQDKFNSNYIGETFGVLFEQNKDDICEGYTDNYIFVKVKQNEVLTGQILKARLLENHTEFMEAEISK